MLTLLLGEDVYAKNEYVRNFQAQSGLDIQKFSVSEQPPRLDHLGGNDLFGKGKVYVFDQLLKQYELPELERAAASSASLLFLEDSIDKRLTKTKKLFAIAEVKDFAAPDSHAAVQWIVRHAKDMSLEIDLDAATELAERLVGETKASLSVVAAHNELLKLASYASGKKISADVVALLTPRDIGIDIFTLLDHVANNRKPQAVALLERYYQATSEDEKVLTIRLVALLSDQMRNILLIKQLTSAKQTDTDILQQTGWKSGRLYIMKKLSARFSEKTLHAALNKFYNLEKELKSSTLPSRVIVDMIIAAL